MFEQFIHQIAFVMSAVICVLLDDVAFRGDKGWVKTFLSGHQFASKHQGFLWFLVEIIIFIPLVALVLQSFIQKQLTSYKENLWLIIVVFLGLVYLYYNKKYFGKFF